MAKTSYFMLTYGLQGCYMPDSDIGPYAVTRRKDLVATLRDALEFYGAPKSALRQVLLAPQSTVGRGGNEWSGSPDPNDPDNFWIDDATGERVNAVTGQRS